MRRSNLESLRERKKGEFKKVETDFEGFFKLILGDTPLPTQWAFICDPTLATAYMGAAGVAKTSTLCAAGLARALFMPGTKGLVARHDYNDLKDTTALRAEQMLGKLPKGVVVDRDRQAPMKWWVNPFIEGDVSQITFMGLKDLPSSYEFDWIAIDEADECEPGPVEALLGRLRGSGDQPEGHYKLMLAFNPPAKNHWLYTACTGRDYRERKDGKAWLKLYKPLPNENQKHLPADYYETIKRGASPELIQRLVEGEWGSTFEGQPVYREFRYGFHVKTELEFSPYEPLFRFWDFGFTRPACIWAQLTWDGRMLILREELGESEEATNFARRCKGITAAEFAGARKILDFGDPAVRQRKDTGSTLQEFAKEGITIRYVLTDFDAQIRLVRRTLGQAIQGEALLQIAKRCTILVDALKGGYHMDQRGEKPHKDGFYDHLADALRYGLANVLGGYFDGSELPASVAYDRRADPVYSRG